MSGNSLDGVLVLDKPGDMTSRLALNIVYARLRQRTAMGHAGTLDPMATGVLVACLGRTTRLIECIQDLPKIYEAEITFGASSTTDDAEETSHPTLPSIRLRNRCSALYWVNSPAPSCSGLPIFLPLKLAAAGPITWLVPVWNSNWHHARFASIASN